MIDFHNHVLPNIDDGSKSMSMSIEMLENALSWELQMWLIQFIFSIQKQKIWISLFKELKGNRYTTKRT